jgi:hypothetical protein
MATAISERSLLDLDTVRDHYAAELGQELEAQPRSTVSAQLVMIRSGQPVGEVSFHPPSAPSEIKPLVEELVAAIREQSPGLVVLTTQCRWVPNSHHSVFLAAIDREGDSLGAAFYVARQRRSRQPLVITVKRNHPAINPILRPLQAAMRSLG